MLLSLFIIFNVFIILLGIVWFWYVQNEKATYLKIYRQGLTAFKTKDYETAKDLFLKVLLMSSNVKEAFYYLGLIYVELEDYEKAKENFEKALKIAPKDINTLYHFALLHQIQKNYTEAKEYYQKALNQNINHMGCYFNLGRINFDEKDYEKALEYFNKALTIEPANVEIKFFIIKCKDELCNYEEPENGQEIINQYLSLYESHEKIPNFHKSLAHVYAKVGKIDETIEECNKGLEKNPEDIDCHKLIGLVLLLKKDLQGAKQSISTVLNLQSYNEEAHEIMSYILCQQEDRCKMNECRFTYKNLIKKFIKPKK